MRIDPTGRAFDGLSTFLTLVCLNVVFVVTCLPIVTIGAATSALLRVMITFSDHESGNLIKDYFPSFGRTFVRATGLAAATALPALALVYAGVFWASAPQAFALALAVIAFLAAVYLFASFCYAMALTAHFSTGPRRTLANALLLPAAEPASTVALIAIPTVLFSIWVVFPVFGVFVLTIGCVLGAYVAAFVFRRVFSRYPA